jgi:hypothetical protein
MADTTQTKILEVVVDNNKAVAAISEYNRLIDEQRQKQQQLAKDFKEGKISQSEYYKAMAQSKEETKAYSRQVQELSKEVQNNIKMDTEKAGSLRALRAELSNVTKAYDELSEEERKSAKGLELKAKIQDITTQLKNSEAETGRFYRNVGNYADSFVEAFTRMGGSAGGVVGPINNAKMALGALSKTPVIAILGALVTVIQKVIQNLKSSEATMNAVTVALAPLNAGSRLLTNIMQKLGEGIAVAVTKLTEWADKLGLVTEAMKTEQQLVKDEIALQLRERDILVENAESQLKVSQLRAQAADKSNYSARERVEILREAVAEEEKIAARELEVARERLRIQEEQAKLAANSKEDNDAIAQSRAEVLRAEQAYYDKTRELQAQIVEAENAQRTEMLAAITARLNAEKTLLEQELALTRKDSEERLELQKKAREAEYKIAVQSAKTSIKDKASLNQTLLLLEQAYLRDIENLDKDHQRALVDEQRKALQNRVDVYKEGSRDQLTAAVALKKYELETLARLEDESDAEFEARRIAAQKALANAEQALVSTTIEQARLTLENKVAELASGSLEQLQAEIELRKFELERIQRSEGESDEEFYARKLAAQEAYNAAKAQLDAAEVEAVRRKSEAENIARLEGESDEEFYARKLAAQEAYNAAKAQLDAAEVELTTQAVQLDAVMQEELETSEEFYARKLAAQKAYNDAVRALLDEETRQRLLALENQMNELADGSLAQMRAELELRKAELDSLHQMEEESDAAFYARKLAAQKAYNDSKKSLAAEELAIATDTAAAIGDLSGSIADMIMQVAGDNKKAAELSKKLALAQIAIETGVATAKGISSAMSVPFPANLAAIAATIATVLSGITSAIASVKSAKFATGGYVSGPGSGTSDSVPAMLSNGESVMNARSTAMFGPLLSSLNQAGGGIAFNPSSGGQREGYQFLAAAVAAGMKSVKLNVGVDEVTRVQNRVEQIKEISEL